MARKKDFTRKERTKTIGNEQVRIDINNPYYELTSCGVTLDISPSFQFLKEHLETKVSVPANCIIWQIKGRIKTKFYSGYANV